MTDTLIAYHDRMVAQLGHHERGHTNCNEYSAALHRGCESWCADLQVAMAQQGGVAVVSTSASCIVIEAAAKKAGRWLSFDAIRMGDWVLYHFAGEHPGANHMGWCEQRFADYLVAIEGNTSDQSNTNGGTVARRRRARAVVRGGVRLDYSGGAVPMLLQVPSFLVPDNQLVEIDLVRDVLHYPDLISGTGPVGKRWRDYILQTFDHTKAPPTPPPGSAGVGTRVAGWGQFTGATRYETRRIFLAGIGWKG